MINPLNKPLFSYYKSFNIIYTNHKLSTKTERIPTMADKKRMIRNPEYPTPSERSYTRPTDIPKEIKNPSIVIGEIIKDLRTNKNNRHNMKRLTQDQLAERLGVTRNTIQFWESGIKTPTQDHMILLSKVFDCDIEHLYGSQTEERKNTKPAAEYIGISEDAVTYMRHLLPKHKEILNEALTNGILDSVFSDLECLISSRKDYDQLVNDLPNLSASDKGQKEIEDIMKKELSEIINRGVINSAIELLKDDTDTYQMAKIDYLNLINYVSTAKDNYFESEIQSANVSLQVLDLHADEYKKRILNTIKSALDKIWPLVRN